MSKAAIPNKLPVTLLTGFLGSGKTTVLNKLIQAQSHERILVIENEVGQINVDGALVEKGVDEVIELTAGCLCCSLSDELLDVLEVVSTKRSEIDRLVIETTGVADPSSIIQTFVGDTIVQRFFNLEQVICIADSGLVEDWVEDTEEALRQIVMADILLMNKSDTVNPIYLEELTLKLKEINPYAEVYSGKFGHFPFNEIMQNYISNHDMLEEKLTKMSGIDVEEVNIKKGVKESKHKINTFTLTFEQPFLLNDHFSLLLYRLVNLYRHQLYRLKGILYVADHHNKVILQSVRTKCVVTDGSTWKESEKKESKLVFIGRGLEKSAFEKLFGQHTKKKKSNS